MLFLLLHHPINLISLPGVVEFVVGEGNASVGNDSIGVIPVVCHHQLFP